MMPASTLACSLRNGSKTSNYSWLPTKHTGWPDSYGADTKAVLQKASWTILDARGAEFQAKHSMVDATSELNPHDNVRWYAPVSDHGDRKRNPSMPKLTKLDLGPVGRRFSITD